MKAINSSTLVKIVFFFFLLFASTRSFCQNPVNWTQEQLMEPVQLAQRLKTGDTSLLIVSVGPGALIPRSLSMGPVQEKEKLAQLEKELKGINRNTEIVVYCGCCPFEHCPNVRPAIDLLQQMKFTNYKLLNLPHNIKADWLDKGYPSVKL